MKARRAAAHERMVQKTYSLPPGGYARLLAAQGGVCYICRRASGRTKRLSVDHNHACCPGPVSCGRCIRGALCGPCNQILGRFRDDPTVLLRAAQYLINPPAQRLAVVDLDNPGVTSLPSR